jgi:NADP-dependent 3-hydroxy acid dehydrogenase YdfG
MHWTNLLVDLKLWTITNTKEVEYENKPFHQTVIVTGGATGIGDAVAAQFGEQCLLNLPVAVGAFEQKFIGEKT